MPYVDKLKNLLKHASHPTAIAIFGSVGIHAALGVLLPTLPLFPKEAPIRRNVRVVQLSPDQEQRLPNLDPPPPMPYTAFPNATQLLPFPDSNPSNEGFSFNPPQSTRSIPLLPSRPDPSLDTPARNSPSVTPPSSVRIRPNTPSSDNIRRQLAALEALRAQQNNNRRRVANLPSSGGTRFQVRDDLSPSELLRQSVQPNPTEEPTEETVETPLHDGNSPIVLNPRNPQMPERPDAANGENATESMPAESPEERIRQQQQIIARLQQEREQNRQNSGNSESGNSPLAWSQAVQQNSIKRRSIAGQYPQAACNSKAEGTTIYGLVVDGNGSIANLRPLQSAGNSILDRAAQAQLGRANLVADGAPTPYYVAVSFQYNPEICTAQGTPQPEATPQPDNNEGSTPPRATPQPSPETPKPDNTQRPAPPPETPKPENSPRPTPPRATPQPPPEMPKPDNTQRPPATPPKPEVSPSPSPSPSPENSPVEPEQETTEVEADSIAVPTKPAKE
jgi:TonB family protein